MFLVTYISRVRSAGRPRLDNRHRVCPRTIFILYYNVARALPSVRPRWRNLDNVIHADRTARRFFFPPVQMRSAKNGKKKLVQWTRSFFDSGGVPVYAHNRSLRLEPIDGGEIIPCTMYTNWVNTRQLPSLEMAKNRFWTPVRGFGLYSVSRGPGPALPFAKTYLTDNHSYL